MRISAETEIIFKKYQIEFKELKNTITKLKNSPGRFAKAIHRFDVISIKIPTVLFSEIKKK